jgi:methoxymalonate biosynthesis acyl carrier protein
MSTEITELRDTVRAYIAEHVGQDPPSDDIDLFETGLANSLFVVQIVMWVEKVLGIPVGDADLQLRNFSSIEAITAYVRRKRDG